MCSCRGGEEEAREPERLDQHFYEEISKYRFQIRGLRFFLYMGEI